MKRQRPATPAPRRAQSARQAARPAAPDAQELEAERVAHRIMAGAAPCNVCVGAQTGVQAKARSGGVRSAGLPAATATATAAAGGGGGAALSVEPYAIMMSKELLDNLKVKSDKPAT